MLEVIDDVHAAERQYYDSLTAEHHEAIQWRNDGIQLVKAGKATVGLAMLQDSMQAFGGADLVAVPPTGEAVERERYASAYMLARGLLLAGEYATARTVAMVAYQLTPQVPTELQSKRLIDQYEAIASGRLALILATMEHGYGEDQDWEVREAAVELAERARVTAQVSENPKHVLFPAGKKSRAWRVAARTRHRMTARAALVAPQLPTTRLRKAVARRFM